MDVRVFQKTWECSGLYFVKMHHRRHWCLHSVDHKHKNANFTEIYGAQVKATVRPLKLELKIHTTVT